MKPGAINVRDASEADLPTLRGWPGHMPVTAELPNDDTQRLLVACRGDGPPCATLRLAARIGLVLPRAWYRVGLVVHAAAELKLYRQQRTLLLTNDLTGCAELSEIAAAPGAGDALAALIDHAVRIAAADPAHWGERLIAELPGRRDADGQSPFWQGLTRHFFKGDPGEAQARHGGAWRCHIAALLPRQIIYAAFLPEAAQAAIGVEAEASSGQRAALEAAGLRWRGQVMIDDAGPVLELDLG